MLAVTLTSILKMAKHMPNGNEGLIGSVRPLPEKERQKSALASCPIFGKSFFFKIQIQHQTQLSNTYSE